MVPSAWAAIAVASVLQAWPHTLEGQVLSVDSSAPSSKKSFSTRCMRVFVGIAVCLHACRASHCAGAPPLLPCEPWCPLSSTRHVASVSSSASQRHTRVRQYHRCISLTCASWRQCPSWCFGLCEINRFVQHSIDVCLWQIAPTDNVTCHALSSAESNTYAALVRICVAPALWDLQTSEQQRSRFVAPCARITPITELQRHGNTCPC